MAKKLLFKHESIAFEVVGFLSDYYGGKQLLKILIVKKSSKGDHILYVNTLEQLQELIWLLEEAKYDLEGSFTERKEFFSIMKIVQPAAGGWICPRFARDYSFCLYIFYW